MLMNVRRWSHRHLVAAWAAYWAVLLIVVLWPLIRAWAVSTLTRQHGSASVTLSDGDFVTALLWVAGPPLLMSLLWIGSRPRR